MAGKPQKNLAYSVLLDFYGPVLTDKQRVILTEYYDEDLSLAEIAENLGITRQGVRLLPAFFLSCFCAVGRSGLRNLVNPENAPQYLDIFSAKRRKRKTGTKFLFIHPGT